MEGSMQSTAAAVDCGGASWRRRQRRLRQFLRHERLSVAMALSETKQNASRGQNKDRAGEEAATHRVMLPPGGWRCDRGGRGRGTTTQKPGDDECVPVLGGGRPAPVLEPRPPEGMGRHTGVGYEVLLDVRVPQLGRRLVEPPPLVCTRMVAQHKRRGREQRAGLSSSTSGGKRRKKRKRRRKKLPKGTSSSFLCSGAVDQGIMFGSADELSNEYVQRADVEVTGYSGRADTSLYMKEMGKFIK